MRANVKVVLVSLLVFVTIGSCFGGQLSPWFYRKTCPQLETIARTIVWKKVAANPNLAAKLLRLHYHDCFVQGCDASMLIDSTSGNTAEKDARPNKSLEGYEIIDEIKAELEEKCPDTVSCADIVAVAARDAVSHQFGRSMWAVFGGRKDGRVSLAAEANRDLPSGGANYTTLLDQFVGLGLNYVDLVALSGAHTLGVAHCVVFARRLNFTGKGDTDPSLDPTYANFLRTQCPSSAPNPATTVALDQGSSDVSFDSHYYVGLRQKRGLLASDAALLTDSRASWVARRFQNFHVFMVSFGKSMMKMGQIGIKAGKDGEIRKNCRAINS